MTRHPLELEALSERGWLEIPDYFDSIDTLHLYEWARSLSEKERMRPATIRSNKIVNENVRSDSIFWIDDWQANEALASYRDEILAIGRYLSQELRVPLKSFEGHFSHYGAGDFYLKHLDQHLGQRHRQITLVSYLNDCDGGELVVYKNRSKNEVDETVYPKAGKLVLFLSAFIFHEVKPSKSDRFGLTGWYRDDGEVFSPGLVL